MTNEVVMHQAQRKQLCIDICLGMTILISTFNLYIGKKVHIHICHWKCVSKATTMRFIVSHHK